MTINSPDYKYKSLKHRKDSLLQEHEAITKQLMSELDPSRYLRLERKLGDLERQIVALDTQLRIAQANAQQDTSLDLSNCDLIELPIEIYQLTHLITLNLSGNQLRILSSDIMKLRKLTSLNLSDNELTELPKQIGQLTHLQTLYLGHNNLTQLPLDICRLTDLKSLNLQYNQLTSLPLEIQCLEALEELHLYGNNLLIPNEFLKCNKYKPQRIIERYLKEHEKNNNNI